MAETGSNQFGVRGKPTICWDCANACGGCNWSANLEPVKGWEAEKTRITTSVRQTVESWRVIKCPEFKRDARMNGLVREEPKKKNGKPDGTAA